MEKRLSLSFGGELIRQAVLDNFSALRLGSFPLPVFKEIGMNEGELLKRLLCGSVPISLTNEHGIYGVVIEVSLAVYRWEHTQDPTQGCFAYTIRFLPNNKWPAFELEVTGLSYLRKMVFNQDNVAIMEFATNGYSSYMDKVRLELFFTKPHRLYSKGLGEPNIELTPPDGLPKGASIVETHLFPKLAPSP